MTEINRIYARITGTGSYLPGSPVSNDDLVSRGVETSDEWIVGRTGISTRHLATTETTSFMASEAARRALAAAGLLPSDIDLIIVATTTPDMVFPSTACLVQQELEIPAGVTAFDVQAVCSGFVYALTVAEKFLRSGSHRHALVIGAEVLSRLLDWKERSTCVLFGDGAGALVLSAGNEPGILESALHADGSQRQILNTDAKIAGGQIQGSPFLYMEGQSVFKLAVKVLGDVGLEVLDKAGMSLDQLDWFIPHQANIRIIQSVAKRLQLDMNRVVVTVDRHGNTSAASVPLALDTAVRDGRILAGQSVLLQGVGGGFTWGAVLARF